MPVRTLFVEAAILVALVGFGGPASAQDSIKMVQNRTFIAEGEIDLTQFLPPPPANDSATTQKELAELLRWQFERTPDQIAFAKADANISVSGSQMFLDQCLQRRACPLPQDFLVTSLSTLER